MGADAAAIVAPTKKFDWTTVRMVVMLSMTLGFFFVEIVVGYMYNSMALVADSFHMLSDVLALLIATACLRIARRPSSNISNTFGWRRAEVLGALINAVFLLALCFSIFVEALKRLIEPEEIKEPLTLMYVGIIGLVVNVIGIFLFHGHATMHGHSHGPAPVADTDQMRESMNVVEHNAHSVSIMVDHTPPMSDETAFTTSGDDDTEDRPLTTSTSEHGHSHDKKPQSHGHSHDSGALNMHGVFLHIMGDAIGSVIVIVNSFVCWRVDSEVLNQYLDPCLSLVLVLIICVTTTPLLKESCRILLQMAPKDKNIPRIKEQILMITGVLAVHDFHVWRLAGNRIIATIHVLLQSAIDYEAAVANVKAIFHEHGIHATTIQPEFVEMAHESADVVGMLNDSQACYLSCPPKADCDESTQCCQPATVDLDVPVNVRQRSNTDQPLSARQRGMAAKFVVMKKTDVSTTASSTKTKTATDT